MRVKYFADTDTALVEFTENEIAETREISENIYVDLDMKGNLVSMTIEHAHQRSVAGVLISGSPPSTTGGGPKHMSATGRTFKLFKAFDRPAVVDSFKTLERFVRA